MMRSCTSVPCASPSGMSVGNLRPGSGSQRSPWQLTSATQARSPAPAQRLRPRLLALPPLTTEVSAAVAAAAADTATARGLGSTATQLPPAQQQRQVASVQLLVPTHGGASQGVPPGSRLALVGSVPELGGWAEAVVLRRVCDGVVGVVVELPLGVGIEAKLLVIPLGGTASAAATAAAAQHGGIVTATGAPPPVPDWFFTLALPRGTGTDPVPHPGSFLVTLHTDSGHARGAAGGSSGGGGSAGGGDHARRSSVPSAKLGGGSGGSGGSSGGGALRGSVSSAAAVGGASSVGSGDDTHSVVPGLSGCFAPEVTYFPPFAGPATLHDVFALGVVAPGGVGSGSASASDNEPDDGSSPGGLEPYPMVQFSVPGQPPSDPDNHLLLCGSIPELGGWRTEDGLRMAWRGGRWVARAALPANTSFEAKVMRHTAGQYSPEPGPPRTFTLSHLLRAGRCGQLSRLSSAPLNSNSNGAAAVGGPLSSADLFGPDASALTTMMFTCYWGVESMPVLLGPCFPEVLAAEWAGLDDIAGASYVHACADSSGTAAVGVGAGAAFGAGSGERVGTSAGAHDSGAAGAAVGMGAGAVTAVVMGPGVGAAVGENAGAGAGVGGAILGLGAAIGAGVAGRPGGAAPSATFDAAPPTTSGKLEAEQQQKAEQQEAEDKAAEQEQQAEQQQEAEQQQQEAEQQQQLVVQQQQQLEAQQQQQQQEQAGTQQGGDELQQAFEEELLWQQQQQQQAQEQARAAQQQQDNDLQQVFEEELLWQQQQQHKQETRRQQQQQEAEHEQQQAQEQAHDAQQQDDELQQVFEEELHRQQQAHAAEVEELCASLQRADKAHAEVAALTESLARFQVDAC
ncbi:hypothetical protein FOA52_008891 [Chlamydomonas sp. UWO 241]|nr:hypothetical protein FOA52_008891 [Chlamydomonas sp. UWO 241]